MNCGDCCIALAIVRADVASTRSSEGPGRNGNRAHSPHSKESIRVSQTAPLKATSLYVHVIKWSVPRSADTQRRPVQIVPCFGTNVAAPRFVSMDISRRAAVTAALASVSALVVLAARAQPSPKGAPGAPKDAPKDAPKATPETAAKQLGPEPATLEKPVLFDISTT